MNRRANIEEKTLNFSPTGITVPKADQSGEIVMGGVQNFAKGLMQLEDKMDTIAATVKFGDFSAAYARGKADLQLQYAGEPEKYEEAAKALGSKLTTEFSKTMRSGVAQKFDSMTLNHLTADRDNLVDWTIQQEKVNTLGGIDLNYLNVELAAQVATTVGALKEVLGDGPAGLKGVYNTATGAITPASNNAKFFDTRTKAIKHSMNARLISDPAALHGELESGKYDGTLTPTEVRYWQDQAFDDMIKGRYRKQFESIKTTSVTLASSVNAVLSGTGDIGEISRMADLYRMHKGDVDAEGKSVFPPKFFKALDDLEDMARSHMPDPKEKKDEDKKLFLQAFDTKWNAFFAKEGDKNTPNYAYEELAIYSDLVTGMKEGTIDAEDLANRKYMIDKKILTSTGKVKEGMSIDAAFEMLAKNSKAWWGWAKKNDDMYSHGYQLIRKKVMDMSTVPADKKQALINQYYVTYMDRINKFPPAEIDKIRNYKTTAENILNGQGTEIGLFKKMLTYQHPERPAESLIYGQETLFNGIPVVFLGQNPDTEGYIFRPSEEVINGLEVE